MNAIGKYLTAKTITAALLGYSLPGKIREVNISIVIPNYNGEEILKKNLPKVYDSVKEYTKGTVEIIIPDDPSTDNSAAVIANFIKTIHHPNIVCKTITNTDKKRSGFTKNVTRGVSLATGDILLLLNSDVAPHKDFLAPLLPHFDNPNVFAVACMDESIENEKIVLRGRGIGKWERGFMLHHAGELNQNNTLWASGGSSAFRLTVWRKLGGLYQLYNPFYWEDIDLSYRARKSGYDIRFEKNSRVIHEHSKGAIQMLHKKFTIQKTAYRNQFFFVWVNITDSSYLLSHIIWLPYHVIHSIFKGDHALVLGFIDALLSLPAVLRVRRKNKLVFKTSDHDILRSIT